MSEPVPSPTWDEYLAAATAHLGAVRRAAERGAAPPAPPERPVGAMPENRRDQAARLAVGYDQLAGEVMSRMSSLAQRGSSSARRSPHHEPGPARYIDVSI
jgi:hypothetical protein